MGRLIRDDAMTFMGSAALLLVAASAAAQQPDSGTFTLLQHGSEIATESFTRSATLLETALAIAGQGTFQTTGRLRPDATLSRLEVRVFGPGGATGEPIQSSAVSFRDGMTIVEQPIGTTVGEPKEVPAGVVPYLNPSPSFMEQILRRARAVGGDTVEVQVWTPSPAGGLVLPAAIIFAGDAATLTLGGVLIEIATDPTGRLLSATVPSQSLVIKRN